MSDEEIALLSYVGSWGTFFCLDDEAAHIAEIQEAQREEVFWTWYFTGCTDTAWLSDTLYLPVWTVQRRLYELGLGPKVEYARCRRYVS